MISIVIPVYNRERTLPRLFRSLLSLTYRPLEVILVDNMSGDSSFKLCQEFQEQNSQEHFFVRLTRNERQGTCSCRNKGLAMARGEYVYFFDSDDEISAEFFEDARQYEGADMICAPTVMYFEDGTRKVRDFIPSSSVTDHIITSMLSTQSCLLRTEFMKSAGAWNENLRRWNDWELGIRLLLHCPRLIWMKGKAYHKIYQHSDSISGKTFSEDYDALLIAIETAHEDIRLLSDGPNELRRNSHALAAKLAMLSSQLYREKDKIHSKDAQQKVNVLLSDHFVLRCLFNSFIRLAKFGVRGTWRLYHLFIS